MNRPSVFLRVNRVAPDVCAQAKDVTVADLHESTAHLGFSGLMAPLGSKLLSSTIPRSRNVRPTSG